MENKKENESDNLSLKMKESQIFVAQMMKLPQEMVDLLKTDSLNYQQREWLSIAMKLGVSLDKVKTIMNFSPQQIYREIMEFLRIKLGNTDSLKKMVESELKQFREIIAENKQLRETLINNLEVSMNQTILLQNEKIGQYENVIEELNKKIQKIKQEKYIEGNSPSTKISEQNTEIDKDKYHLLKKITGLMKHFSFPYNKEFKTIECYIKNPNMSDEQKRFILDAWEDGMSAKEISSFASENLSVDIMKRIKETVQRRKYKC